MLDAKKINRFLLAILLLMLGLIVAATVWHSLYVSRLTNIPATSKASEP